MKAKKTTKLDDLMWCAICGQWVSAWVWVSDEDLK